MGTPDTTSWDEATLVRAAQRGNLDAFNALILHYQTQVYNLAYHLLQDPASADDATQEAFISAYRSMSQFRGGSFRAWLLRIVTNACYDAMRYTKRRPSVSWEDFGDVDEEANPHLRDEAELPEEFIERGELREVLEDAMTLLPEEQRAVLVLVDRLGLSYEEVAETMQIQLGTVKSRLARARGKMRDLLLERRELLPGRYRLDSRV
ncbi:MAG: sigma-70 family RNA polymerase sigma factor [Anaerolineae bacterium]|nr:sigma-70 family RNA polymerase sigma factor [Anaerolineae bacterium]